MAGHSAEDIKKETRVYILVFVALAALTLVTVGVSYLDLSGGCRDRPGALHRRDQGFVGRRVSSCTSSRSASWSTRYCC